MNDGPVTDTFVSRHADSEYARLIANRSKAWDNYFAVSERSQAFWAAYIAASDAVRNFTRGGLR